MMNDESVIQFDPNGHLTVDAVSELAGGALSTDPLVLAHIRGCERCQLRIRETGATIALFQQMPDMVASRSFTLPVPSTPTSTAPMGSLSERLFGWLQPAMPALRSATIAAFLLFLSVTFAGNWLDDGGSPDDSAPAGGPATELQQSAPTIVSAAPAANAEGGDSVSGAGRMSEPASAAQGDNANDSAMEQNAEQENAVATDNEAPSSAVGDAGSDENAPVIAGVMQPTGQSEAFEVAEAASPFAEEPVSTASPTRQSATPEPVTLTDDDTPSSTPDKGWSSWRVAQVILLGIFLILSALWIWARQRAKSP